MEHGRSSHFLIEIGLLKAHFGLEHCLLYHFLVKHRLFLSIFGRNCFSRIFMIELVLFIPLLFVEQVLILQYFVGKGLFIPLCCRTRSFYTNFWSNMAFHSNFWSSMFFSNHFLVQQNICIPLFCRTFIFHTFFVQNCHFLFRHGLSSLFGSDIIWVI